MEFKDKKILITGAASGIGRSIALEYAKEGGKLILCDVDSKKGEELLKEIQKFSPNSLFFELDITSNLDKFKEILMKKVDSIDILIPNAGIIAQPCGINDATEESISKTIDTNLKGTYQTLKVLGSIISKKGSIVTISSIDGIIGEPYAAIYSTTKAGIISLTKSFARHYAKKEIRVNCVAPGLINTPLTDSSGELISDTTDFSLIKRIGKPEEIAKPVLFLSSDDASFITGETLIVDGGFHLK